MVKRKYPDEPVLIEVVLNNDRRELVRLLAAGADPNSVSSQGAAALTLAAGNAALALDLIDAGADLGRADPGTINPVWAVLTGRADVVAKVLDAGGELNCQTGLGTPLHLAARRGMTDVLRLLIERGADVNAGNSVGKPLSDAVRENHPACVELLIESGARLETAPHAADTLLARATHNRSEAIVDLLLAAGLPPDERGKISEMDRETYQHHELYANATPLMIAARLGELEIADALLQAGANPLLRDEEGRRPLDLAREHGQPHVAARLAAALAALADTSGDPGEELLLAAEQGDVDRVRGLIARAPDINVRDARSEAAHSTPLLLAARHGHLGVVRLLLEAGADPSLNDAGDEKAIRTARWMYREADVASIREAGLTLGRAPLHEAAGRGDAELVDTLLAADAPVDPPDVLGLTPLLLAARGGHPAVLRRLLSAGANPRAVHTDKSGALAAAVAGDNTECVDLLLKAGVKLPGGKKQNLLMRAAIRGSLPIVDTLARAGAPVDASDQFGNTPLIEAAEAGHVEVVQRLIALGADVNHRNDLGDTALVRGATLGVSTMAYQALRERNDPLLHRKVEMARVLLDAGAEVNALSSHGQGALAMAAFTLNEPLVRFLLDRGADPSQGDVGGTPLELARRNRFAPDLIERLSQGIPPETGEEPAAAGTAVAVETPSAPERALLPPPDFSAALEQPEYLQALAELERRCGTRAVPLAQVPGAFHTHVDSRSGFDFEAARREFLSRGYTLVWIDPSKHQQVGLFPTRDQFEVVLAMGTNGANYELCPEDIAAWLRALHAEQPFEITALRYDVVAGQFLTDVREPRELAKRMYAFCPDIVDQGTGSVAALALSLQQSRALYFWWD